ncbi:MAG: response regulator [Spirochaetia bacterium]|jgi:CheY-like chemotaxis protein
MDTGPDKSSNGEIRGAKTVLVIDDEELNLKLVTRMLTGEGFRVLSASSAEAGLELLRQKRPDVILMDIRLGGMDGLTATRRVKADPVFASIPVVGVSAYAMEEDSARASQAGCSGYISKPFTKKELVETVRRFAGI